MGIVASERCSLKREWNIPRGKISPWLGDIEADQEALCAEWAVGAVLGTLPDCTHHPGPDDGTDLRIPNLTVQVKLNHYPDGDLYVNAGEEITSDVAVLVVPEGDYLCLCGWVDRETFHREATIKNYGYGDRLAYPRSKLFGMNRLMRRLLNAGEIQEIV